MFKHKLGYKAKSRTTQLSGVLTSVSLNLYGCNRYFIQPPVNPDGKVPDGWWVDEEDVEVISEYITHVPNNTGGPMSKIR